MRQCCDLNDGFKHHWMDAVDVQLQGINCFRRSDVPVISALDLLGYCPF